jgi:soluble lytic murein transglycosylase-like protein
MSIEAVMSRVSQLQAMLVGATPSAPTQATGSDTGSFSSALADATTAAALGDGTATGTPTTATDPTTLASLASPIGGLPAATASAGTGATLPASVPYAAQITAAARANGVDPALLAGLIKQESGFNPNAGSGAGARGLTQLMPATAAALGVTNVLDPQQSIEGGAKYLKRQLDAFGGDVTKALAAYNAGPGAVRRYGGVPPYAETQNYVRAVQANAAAFRSSTT